MLTKAAVQAAQAKVLEVFKEMPKLYASVQGSVVLYEVVIDAPFCRNVGRGTSLQAAVQQLCKLNHKEG